jgi:hypothetical protein
MEASPVEIAAISITRRWLIPQALRPKLYWPHPTMSAEDIRRNTQSVWDTFYGLKSIWARSRFIKSLRARLAFVLISKICGYGDRDRQCSGHVSTCLPAVRCHTCRFPNSERLYWDELPFAWMERVSSAVSRERSQ